MIPSSDLQIILALLGTWVEGSIPSAKRGNQRQILNGLTYLIKSTNIFISQISRSLYHKSTLHKYSVEWQIVRLVKNPMKNFWISIIVFELINDRSSEEVPASIPSLVFPEQVTVYYNWYRSISRIFLHYTSSFVKI